MARGVNATSKFSGAFSDTSTHYLPDTAGGAEGYDVRTWDRASVVVTNNQDQDASVDLEGSAFDDPAMADAGTLASTTVAAGTTEVLSVPVDAAAAYLRLAISFATAPTGNNPIEATFQTDNDGR